MFSVISWFALFFLQTIKNERLLVAGAPAIFSSLNDWEIGDILFHQYLSCQAGPGLANIYVCTYLAYYTS